MSERCNVQLPNYTEKRNEILDEKLAEFREIVRSAEQSNGWGRFNHTQKEQRLTSTTNSNGVSALDIINELRDNNNRSARELAELNEVVSKQNIEINNNNKTLRAQHDKINSSKDIDLLTKNKISTSEDRNKQSQKWYMILLVSLIVLLTAELIIIIFVLKK